LISKKQRGKDMGNALTEKAESDARKHGVRKASPFAQFSDAWFLSEAWSAGS
jgi:N-acetylglutamate synthase-like GNAT family acetyltransferase